MEKDSQQEPLDHVFELFTTGDACKDNCTGIGLSIANMIMEAHGGSIIIGNNPGGGASVKLLVSKHYSGEQRLML